MSTLIAQRIKILRNDFLKMTQQEFGKCLGVSRDVIKNIENNRLANPCQKEPLYKLICNEFNINPNWLTNGTGEPQTGIAEELLGRVQKLYALSNNDLVLLKEICESDYSTRSDIRKIYSFLKFQKEEGC